MGHPVQYIDTLTIMFNGTPCITSKYLRFVYCRGILLEDYQRNLEPVITHKRREDGIEIIFAQIDWELAPGSILGQTSEK